MKTTREERLFSLLGLMLRDGVFDNLVLWALEDALNDTIEDVEKALHPDRSFIHWDELRHDIHVGHALVTCCRYFGTRPYTEEREFLSAALEKVAAQETDDETQGQDQ